MGRGGSYFSLDTAVGSWQQFPRKLCQSPDCRGAGLTPRFRFLQARNMGWQTGSFSDDGESISIQESASVSKNAA
jgi:hypothetical protein